MMDSLSSGTIKQYEKPLRLWWDHCMLENISPFEASVSDILLFLSNTFNNVGTYGTLNSYRSAISLITSCDISSNPLMKRFFKGVSIAKPQTPRYDCTWDPQVVLSFLKNLYPNEDLSIENLTQKLIMLLALSTSQRLQTLSKISLDNIIRSNEDIQIKIPDRIKTSKINKLQPCLMIPFFQDQPELCVASTLEAYIEKTKSSRKSVKELFITCKKPFRAASTQTLARWIKITLKNSGIDTSLFKAHSTRHASSSAAKRNGINVEIIRQTAGWTEKSLVFTKFYNRPLHDKTLFAKAVLRNSC